MARNSKSFGVSGLAACIALSCSLPALAAQKHKKAPPQEIYPAMETEDLRTTPAPAKSPKAPAQDLSYDPVPSDQIDGMATRLHLVEALIRRHGRAYDYRVHTVRELQAILAKLETPPAAPSTGY